MEPPGARVSRSRSAGVRHTCQRIRRSYVIPALGHDVQHPSGVPSATPWRVPVHPARRVVTRGVDQDEPRLAVLVRAQRGIVRARRHRPWGRRPARAGVRRWRRTRRDSPAGTAPCDGVALGSGRPARGAGRRLTVTVSQRRGDAAELSLYVGLAAAVGHRPRRRRRRRRRHRRGRAPRPLGVLRRPDHRCLG